MTSTSTVFPRTARFKDGRLVAVGGVAVAELAAVHGTPLYVLDHDELVGRMRAYRSAFGDDVTVAYAAKALCVVGILQLAAAEGLGVDVASAGELATATAAGVPTDRLILHGNNKSLPELRTAAEAGVGRIVVDSFTELDRLAALARETDRTVDVLLRITPGVQVATHSYIATGQDDSKFGFTLSAGLAHDAISRALQATGVRLHGLHCHLGSQVTAAEAYEAAAALCVRLLADVRDRHGVILDELNLGGGLAIPYVAGDVAPDLARHAAVLRAAVAREAGSHGLPTPRLVVEPGRSIVGPAGVTIYTVGTVKEVPGVRTYVSVDGGMSDNPRPALYDARYTFVLAGPPAARASAGRRVVTVAGKHCESGDVLGRDVDLPEVVEGDLLAVAATGAYGHSMASNYNRLPRPAMVLVGDGRVDLLVRREAVDDVLARDVPLRANHPARWPSCGP